MGFSPPSRPPPSPPYPHLQLCLLAHQLAGARALRMSRDIRDPQIPRNVKGGGWGVGEGRQKLGASHPSGNLRSSPVLRGPAGTQTTPHRPPPSGGNSVFRVSLHLYLYLCPARSPTFPRLQRPGCLCSGHPHSVPLPILIPSCVSQPPTTFCVVLHGFAVNGESGNPAVPRASPQKAGRLKQEQAGCRRDREGMGRQSPHPQSAGWWMRVHWPPTTSG